MLLELLYFLLIGLLAGWLAGLIWKGKGFGWQGNLIVGVIGALLGGFVFRLLQLTPHGLIGSLVTATAGSVLFLFLLNRISKEKSRF